MSVKWKPYNLTYFIRLFAVATLRDPFFIPSHRKPYKMCYIEDFIMKTTSHQEKISSAMTAAKIL